MPKNNLNRRIMIAIFYYILKPYTVFLQKNCLSM